MLRFTAIALWALCSSVLCAQEWPDTKTAWTKREYQVVLKNLESIPPTKLPRASNPEFGEVFKKIVDRQNLDLQFDAQVPLNARMTAYSEFVATINEVNRCYVNAFLSDKSYSVESLQLLSFVLLAAQKQLAIFDQFVVTLDKSDPTYAARMVGLAQVRFGVSRMMLGALQCMQEPQNYNAQQRLELAKVITETFPTFTAKIDRDVAEALQILRDRIATEESDPKIRQAIAGK